MVGIYKITSPSNRIYIGQSWDIQHRWRSYTCKQNKKGQRILFASLSKYGHTAHKFEVVHELPIDVTQEVLNVYEQLYIDAYKDCGVELMNIKGGGSNGKLSEETKKLLSIAHTGKKLSEEHKANLRGKIPSPEVIKKRSEKNIGSKRTEETKKKMAAWQFGKVQSEETKQKIGLANSGKSHSIEHKEKISLKLKGKTFSDDRNRKVSSSMTGKLKTEEHKENISKSRIEKGTGKGSNNGRAILTEQQVKEIKSKYVPGMNRNGRLSLRQIAKEYGIGKTTVAEIVRAERWQHLN